MTDERIQAHLTRMALQGVVEAHNASPLALGMIRWTAGLTEAVRAAERLLEGGVAPELGAKLQNEIDTRNRVWHLEQALELLINERPTRSCMKLGALVPGLKATTVCAYCGADALEGAPCRNEACPLSMARATLKGGTQL